jgi:class 3 adenylate cyclase
MSEADNRYSLLGQAGDRDTAAAIEALVRQGKDPELNRVNALDFAGRHGLDEERVISTFLHATRLGLFDMAWNVLCPGCGGVLQSSATLRSVRREEYACALCAANYEPTLDEMVEVSFTVNPRVRRIAAHDPHALSMWDYQRQIFWSSGIELPEGKAFDELVGRIVIDSVELAPGEKIILSVQLPAEFVIVFDPVTHAAHFLDVKGEPTRERQELTIVYDKISPPTGTTELRPGPLRLTLENRANVRALPGLYIAGHELHDLLGHRRRFLTAKRLVTNQSFRDIYGANALDLDQRLKITSLTFLFTDLKGSTELYERVGDLAAYDLVRSHFRMMNDTIASQAGAVVKTIGDAVMATFPTPDRGIAAALKVRETMGAAGSSGGTEDLVLKMGMHEGPCLAVTVNDRLDYFGQTVNIAARVQRLATTRSIYATEPVVTDTKAAEILGSAGLTPRPERHTLRGVGHEVTVFEIP